MRLSPQFRRKWNTKSNNKLSRIIGFFHYRFDLMMENLYIKNCKLPSFGINKEARNERVIVSMTSFPQRMLQTYYAIKSLMLQTYKADEIILWLSDLQFPERKIPNRFDELIAAGLTIKFTPDDLRSHKKYFYTLQSQKPNEVVVTFDDDIIYEATALERLVSVHQKYPEAIVCEYGNEITLQNGKIAPYNNWKVDSSIGVSEPDLKIMAYTGAGCLYPYNIMPTSTFDKDSLISNAITADDLWMKFNSLAQGIKVIKTRQYGPMLCVIKGSQTEHLGNINCSEGENDKTIKRLCLRFPSAEKRLKELQ